MTRADLHLVDRANEIESQFRSVMRRLAGGVGGLVADPPCRTSAASFFGGGPTDRPR